MKNWDIRVKTLRNILQHLHNYEDDRYIIENPLDQETKFPK
jgi:hypothetical protein